VISPGRPSATGVPSVVVDSIFGRHVGWSPDTTPLGNKFHGLTSAVWHARHMERVFVFVKEDVAMTIEVETRLLVHFA